jgi:hypothetical protein
MTRRPLATVRVIMRPDLAKSAYRVEVDCPASTTGITSLPGGPIDLGVRGTVTFAVYSHEERCGACDPSAAHERGDQTIREHVEATWPLVQAELGRRYMAGRRN